MLQALACAMSSRPLGMSVLIGFSTRMSIPTPASSLAILTCVAFGVQIIAACGLWGDLIRASTEA